MPEQKNASTKSIDASMSAGACGESMCVMKRINVVQHDDYIAEHAVCIENPVTLPQGFSRCQAGSLSLSLSTEIEQNRKCGSRALLILRCGLEATFSAIPRTRLP